MDTAKEFNGLASVYATGRPAYAEKFITDLFEKFGMTTNSVVADIGSGTGKFAKQIIEKGAFVYCVEPNEDMRNQAVVELIQYDNQLCIAGGAEYTKLQDETVDFITTSQAFHWFDVELFKRECIRIIKPNGKVFLIWNMRDKHSELMQKNYIIYKKYCPKFKGFSGGIEKDDVRIKNFYNNNYVRIEYTNPLYYDKAKFIDRCLSSSYSLKQQDSNYEEYIKELESLFDEYSVDNILTIPNKTVVYIGAIK